MLGRADPLPADLDDLPVADRLVEGAPADAVTCLEDADLVPPGLERTRGGEPREARSDYRDVSLNGRA